MPRFEIDVDPVERITADAIGKPGQRVFYLQAQQEARTITILIEKIQLQSLAIGVEKFLAEIHRQNPDLSDAPGDYTEEQMHINPPVEPLFHAGEIGLGYDQERDRVVLIAHELPLGETEPDEPAVVRFWCTRSQARALARWGAEVVQRGRPICSQCGAPMEPEGHFCPKKNGHKH
ncbi:MAG: DUF3090 domain-containing protein [Chloroflexi bacterium]|nr:DUF3090 domain-containing protein [Chloroflexota bacterium]